MNLRSGVRLGPYEIVAPIGAGGMGEVYRARDTRLGRSVAIKVLPAEFSSDAKLKIRFEREAKAISALSHPHICALYDVGSESGRDYLVMEHCEGQTLAQQLERGALPLERVVEYGVQMAEALEKAHRHGIIHRDLKPSNVMITASGVKVLDFGLAKQQSAIVGSGGPTTSTLEKPITDDHKIVGTLQYMAPETITSGQADARSDIFALGAILYEMVAGKPAFEGGTKASLIAAIIEREPVPVSHHQPLTPPLFDRLVKSCLAKDPEERWQTAHDVLLELRAIRDGVALPAADALRRRRFRKREIFAWSLAAGIGIAAVIVALRQMRHAAAPVRFNLDPPAGVELGVDWRPTLAVSKDGRLVAFAGWSGGTRRIYLRDINQVEAHAVPGTEEASIPFFSPDGKWLGVRTGETLTKIPLAGGESVSMGRLRGLPSWGDDDTIVLWYRGTGTRSGLWQVSANGGDPKLLVSLDHDFSNNGGWPQWLPGGLILFSASPGGTEADRKIAVYSPNTGRVHVLMSGGWYPRYDPRSGNLLYVRLGALYAVPLNLRTLEISGRPRMVVDDVSNYPLNGVASVAISDRGSLVYMSGAPHIRQAELISVDRSGTVTSLSPARRGYSFPAPSPDGRRLAVVIQGPTTEDYDVWIRDERDSWSRLTRDGHAWANPVWSPDGEWLVYTSWVNGVSKLFRIRTDGSGEPEQLTTGKLWDFGWSFSPDGKVLAFTRNVQPQFDLFTVAIEGDRTPRPYLTTPEMEYSPAISPDGRWIAYQSEASGRSEVYVRPFPGPGAAIKVSTEGGVYPQWNQNGEELLYSDWRPSGKQLFYLDKTARDGVWAVPVKTGAAFSNGKPRLLFKLESVDCCWASSDGQRFFGVRYLAADREEHHIVYVPNFSDELEKGR